MTYKNKDWKRLQSIWHAMKRRCNDPKHPKYYLYGGRDIKICDEWLNDFQAFYDWAMSNGYKDGLTIDRANANKDYSPTNCRWASYKEQNNHTSRNHMLTYSGKTQTMKQWADETGIPYQTLAKRINAYQWDICRALTTK